MIKREREKALFSKSFMKKATFYTIHATLGSFIICALGSILGVSPRPLSIMFRWIFRKWQNKLFSGGSFIYMGIKTIGRSGILPSTRKYSHWSLNSVPVFLNVVYCIVDHGLRRMDTSFEHVLLQREHKAKR